MYMYIWAWEHAIDTYMLMLGGGSLLTFINISLNKISLQTSIQGIEEIMVPLNLLGWGIYVVHEAKMPMNKHNGTYCICVHNVV